MLKKIFFIFLILIVARVLWIDVTRWQLPDALIQKSVLIGGVIGSVPQKKFHGSSFVFRVTQFNHKKMNTNFLIAWYRHSPALFIGQHWQLIVKLKPPIGVQNPGGFNYADYLIHHDITATGYVVRGVITKSVSRWNIGYLREVIQKNITNSVDNPTLAAFISALCVGLRDGLKSADWQVFQKTGTNHLVAIAGLHIGFVVAAIYFLTDQIARLFPALLLRAPSNRIAEIAALCAAILYSALSGFAIPAERASIMLFILMLARLFYCTVGMCDRWVFAALLILVIYPFDCFEASFYLSFISVGLLIWVMSNRLQSPSRLISWGKMQLTMVVGLLPLMLWFFQQLSIVSFIANMIAIPWVGFFILPIALTASLMCLFHFFWMSYLLFWLSGKCLYPLWKMLCFLSSAAFASWHHALPNSWVLFAGLIAVFLLLAPKQFPAKWVGCFGFLPVFFYHPMAPSVGTFEATVIDVGQGLSVLIQTKRHVMLYDTGAHFPGGFDFGDSVVTPYLRQQGMSTIDRLEISHGDNDHSGGANAIVKNFDVKKVVSSAPKLVTHFHGILCDSTQHWRWDGVRFATLSPEPNMPYEDNNSSCVIKITGKYGQLLLTGDIQRETESRLVAQYGDQLHSLVLIVPHHGSRTSSSNAFISAVSPKYALISAGKYNRYHLPAKSVVTRYRGYHIVLYDTADTGAVIIRFLHTGQVKLSTG